MVLSCDKVSYRVRATFIRRVDFPSGKVRDKKLLSLSHVNTTEDHDQLNFHGRFNFDCQIIELLHVKES